MNLINELHKIEQELTRYKILESRQHHKAINNEKIFNRILYWLDCDCDVGIKMNRIKGIVATRRIIEARTKGNELS